MRLKCAVVCEPVCRSITLSTEDGNFSVSMLLFKDEAFQDRWTTVPALALDQDIFVRVFLVFPVFLPAVIGDALFPTKEVRIKKNKNK